MQHDTKIDEDTNQLNARPLSSTKIFIQVLRCSNSQNGLIKCDYDLVNAMLFMKASCLNLPTIDIQHYWKEVKFTSYYIRYNIIYLLFVLLLI